MGKRTGQLAGLAALGALGYMLSQDKKGERAPVESRVRSSDAPASASVAVEQFTPTPRMVDNGDDRDIGGGFHPAGFRRNMETGEMYDPGTVPNRVATSGAPASAPARVAAPAAPRANLSTPGVSDAYPDESRRGRMTSAPETDDVPGAEAAVARFKKETAGMSPAIAQGRYPMTKRQPITNTYTRKMGAQAGEAEAYRAAQAAKAAQAARAARPDNRPDLSTPEGRKRAEQQQALERVTPEEYFIGGPGVKTVAALAKGLANRTPRLAEMTMQALPAPTARLTGPSASSIKEAERAARAAGRQSEMLQGNAARYGLDPSAPGYEAAMRALRENIGGGAFTVKKKGGAVSAKPKKMASGGSTASRRGDGIAQRGKTRGKLY